MRNLRQHWKNGLPVICTEFGTCEASGNGSYNLIVLINGLNLWIVIK